MISPDQKNWVEKLPMTEFAINSSINESTGYAPFELEGGYMPRMIHNIPPSNLRAPGIKEFTEKALTHLIDAHDSIIESHIIQTAQANKHRRTDPKLKVNDLVYISTKNLRLPKGRATKLLPKYIGPYPIVKARPEKSTYQIGLPTELAKRGIHQNFHVSILRKHIPSDDSLFPNRNLSDPYDFGDPDSAEWLVNEIIGHHWDGRRIFFHIKWDLGDITVEPYHTCKKLQALDRYLELYGIKEWKELPRETNTITKEKSPEAPQMDNEIIRKDVAQTQV